MHSKRHESRKLLSDVIQYLKINILPEHSFPLKKHDRLILVPLCMVANSNRSKDIYLITYENISMQPVKRFYIGKGKKKNVRF